jgi:protoporphyrinogen IX oxidase
MHIYGAWFTLHVVGFAAWIAGLVLIGRLLAVAAKEPDATARTRLATLARKNGILADVGALLSIVSGLVMLFPLGLLRAPWMHIKLTLVVVVILLHGWLRVRARRASVGGPVSSTPAVPILALVLIAIIALAVLRQPMGG